MKLTTHKDIKAKTEKWFYTETVKDHFFNPRNICKTNEELKEFKKKSNGIGVVGSPACIDSETLIRTNPSLKTISILNINDEVLSHDGSHYQIDKVFKPQYKGKVIEIKNQIGKLTATKDHLIFAIQNPKPKSTFSHTRYKKRIPPTWVHAGNLKKGDLVLYPIPKKVQTIKTIDLSSFECKQPNFKSKTLPKKILVTKKLLKLFGYFVAEGHTREKEVRFTFTLNEKQYADDVSKLIKDIFGFSTTIQTKPKNKQIKIIVYNVHLAKLFQSWFGKSAKYKQIPDFILSLNPEIQQGFLNGVWRLDKSFNTTKSQPRAQFTTTSKKLFHQMIWLLLRQKITPSAHTKKAHKKNGISHQEAHHIHVTDISSLEKLSKILKIPFSINPQKHHSTESWFDKNYLYWPIREITSSKFDGRMRNLEVNTSHTYTTDAFLVHNCGDVMEIWLYIENEKIKECKWRTFGCASAIASTSMLSVMITENGGMNLKKARKLKPQDIVKRLGTLPNRKFHCSVLGDKALRLAINDYYRNAGQLDKIIVEGAKVIDKILKITDKDIEEAVLEGANTFEDVQKKTKIGIQDKNCIPETKKLIKFYQKKYFG